ncbi:metallophosphoesterase family protein [Nocardioidaceae bacterium SCSIO 66511]|nr:metallophosphoesterase family protein [Nocardioidaceae bacterium SCSIO 66511]
MTLSLAVRATGIAAVAIALASTACSSAVEDDPGTDERRVAPSAEPSRVILTPTKHPRTMQAFGWRTAESTRRGVVQLHRVGHRKRRTVKAFARRTVTFPDWHYTSRHHRTVVRKLRPDTRYRYRVGRPGAWSTWRTFRTAHGPRKPWTIAYFGDAQLNVGGAWDKSAHRALHHRPSVDMMLYGGDLVDDPTDDSQWTEWFHALTPNRRTTNSLSTVGNHELRGDPHERQYLAHLRMPRNGPRPTAFSIDYQGVRFIVLDANDPSDRAQRRFLKRKLRGAGDRWKVMLFHKPIFAGAVGRDSSAQRKAWLATLERRGADVVLQGHDHVYARGFLRRGAPHEAGARKRPMYVDAVSGGKYYKLDRGDNDWTRHGAKRVEAEQGVSTFQLIRVTRKTLTYRSVVAATGAGTDEHVGDVIDRFRIKRR